MAINSLSSSSYGLSGLASGMNTQEMVEKMLSGTKNKITSTQQKRAQLEYKQDIYRNVATQMRTMQNSFFSFSNPKTNLMSSAFFSKMTASTQSKYFTATASADAKAGSANVDFIKQLAKAASLTGSNKTSAKLSTKHVDNNGVELTNPADIESLVGTKLINSIKRGKIEFSVTGANGERKVEIDTNSPVWKEIAGKSGDDAAQAFNKVLAQSLNDPANPGAYLDPGIKAEFSNGKLSFKATGVNETISMTVNDEAKALLGFSSSTISGAGAVSAAIDTRKLLPSLQVTMDGQEAKTIYLDIVKAAQGGGTNIDQLARSLQDGLDKAYGKDAIMVSTDNTTGKIGFDVKDSSRSFKFEGNDEVMALVGLKSGQSNKVTSGMRLDQINFANKLEGNEFKFSINDVSFNVTSNTTLSSLLSQINNSAAGVKMSYNENTDKFTMESTVSGKGGKIDIKQQQGNLMSALLGVKGNTSVSGETLLKDGYKNSITTGTPTVFRSRGGAISFDVVMQDGRRRNISLNIEAPDDANVYYSDKLTFLAEVNKALGKKDDTKDLGLEFTVGTDGNVTLKSSKDVQIVTNAGAGTVMAQLGFTNGQTNAASSTSTVSDIFGAGNFNMNVGGKSFSFADTTTIAQMRDQLNAATDPSNPNYDPNLAGYKFEWNDKDARFNVVNTSTTGDRTLALDANAQKLFGSSVEFVAQQSGTITDGQDAILSINGNQIERSSNNFTYEGITYSVNQTFDGREKNASGHYKLADKFSDGKERFADDDGYLRDVNGKFTDALGNVVADNAPNRVQIDASEIYRYTERAGQVTTIRDTEQITEGIVKFVDEYNKMIETLHSLVTEEPSYKDYMPLTEDQKSAMSEKEIEQWEEKAKTGLLRSDNSLNKIWNDLRSTIYRKQSTSGLAIYDLGITTTSNSEFGGQLTIDHSKLQEAIKSNPDGIKDMFSNGTDGIATELNNAINRAARISTASPGTLVTIAGSGKSDTTSSMYRQMKEIDKNLESLRNRYDSEYSRHWKQFNAMEKMMSQMNSQSSWLAQQFG